MQSGWSAGLSANTLAAYRADLTFACALARRARRHDHEHIARRSARLHRLARAYRCAAARSTARQLSSFRRFFRYFMREGVSRARRPDRADRHAEDRPLAAEVGDRGGGRSSARRSHSLRSARQPRSHHARSSLRHRPARFLELVNLRMASGQPQPGRAADSRQGQPRAPDSIGRRIGTLAHGVHARSARRDPCSSARPIIYFPRGAAIA